MMADQPDFPLLALGIRRIGWIRFWVQTVLGVVVIGVLTFNKVGNSFSTAGRDLGLGAGLSLTTLAFLFLLYSLWQSWLIVLTGRAINSPARPSRAETGRLLKRGLTVDLLGLVFSSIGYQSLVGALFVQASKQAATMGITIGSAGGGTMDNFPITSLEVLSVLSNTQVLFAHLIGLIFSLWLLQRIYRNRK